MKIRFNPLRTHCFPKLKYFGRQPAQPNAACAAIPQILNILDTMKPNPRSSPESVQDNTRKRWSPRKRAAACTGAACWLIVFFLWFFAPARPFDPAIVASMTPFGRSAYDPEYDIPIYLLGGLVAVGLVTWVNLRAKDAEEGTLTSNHSKERDRQSTLRQPYHLFDLLGPILAILIVCVPDPIYLAEASMVHDGCHHVNFYIMGPLCAFQHGIALGTDFYTQYQCGWVLVAAALSRWLTLDYPAVFGLFSIFGVVYFSLVYLVIRVFSGSAIWGMIGMLASLQWQLFSGTTAPLWIYPSSTVARCPFDLALTLCLWRLGRSHRLLDGIWTGAFFGLSLLFGTDTGIYIVGAMVLVSAMAWSEYIRTRQAALLHGLGVAWVAAIVTWLGGLGFASRGTLFQSAFWSGYFEVFRLYPSGFSAIPMGIIVGTPVLALLTMAILLIYTLRLAGCIGRTFKLRIRPDDYGIAFLAVVGFGEFILCVNRSHPFNLFHPIIPAIVLWSLSAAKGLRRGDAQPHRMSASIVSGVVLTFVLVAVSFNPNFWAYPSILVMNIESPQTTEQRRPRYYPAAVHAVKKAGEQIKSTLREEAFPIVGDDPTLWLVTLNLPPHGRYCPAIPITYQQRERILDQIRAKRFVLEHSPWEIRDGGGESLATFVEKRFVVVQRNPLFTIFRQPESD